MPMAAGMRIRSPGRSARRFDIDASARPARRSPPEEMSSATKPWRRVRCSDRQ